MKRWVILVFALCLLAGCGGEPTPTPDPVATQVAVERAVIATLTAEAPTATPTPTPTLTPSPTFTPTSTPTPTPTATPTQTPTPTPTVLPDVQLEEASRHQAYGDYVDSILSYQDLLDKEPSPDQVREATYRLAESFQQEGEYVAAALAWEQFISLYPDDSRLAQARLMAGRAYQAADLCNQAIDHYQAYLMEWDLLQDRVQEWVGDCHMAEERFEDATGAYRQALSATDDPNTKIHLREKIASVYVDQEDQDAAVAEYDALLALAQTDDDRAKFEYLAGKALADAERIDEAFARYQNAADNYPEAEYAYFALVELVYGGAVVDEFQRGLIDYYAGAQYPDAYGASIRAFDRYLAAEPADKADQALYYKALAQRAVDQAQGALETLEMIITEHPESEILDQVWFEKGATFTWAEDYEAAIEAYEELARLFPTSDLAPQALWKAARLYILQGAQAEAAQVYEQVIADFPEYEDIDEALWRAGLAYYQAGEIEGAIENWQKLLADHPDSVYGTKTRYWLGKVEARPPEPDATGYWAGLVAEMPYNYYTLRIQHFAMGEALTTSRLITASVEAPPWDKEQFDTEILAWLSEWTEVPTGTESLTLPLTPTSELDLYRGQLLLELGMRREALEAFDRVRISADDDPLALAALASYFRERALYGLAARSASQLAELNPEGTIYDAPLPLRTVAYPLAYADLLSAEAQKQGLDPLLLAALLRQESLFEPAAESWVGARGLGQVMPATGQDIATALGIQDFEIDDLYKPATSIQFAAFYLASQLDRFDDQILAALAAYNGGPGNTLYWLETGGDELDLFVEGITAVQSRLYLQGVLEQYMIYEQLYRSVGSSPE